MAIEHDAKAVCCQEQIALDLSKSELLLKFWNERRIFLGCIRRFTPREDARSDIFQEACVRFLTSSAVFDCTERAAKYFYLIIRSLSIDDAKRARRVSYYAEVPEVVCDPQEAWHSRILVEEVREAIRGLSERDRRTLAAEVSPNLPSLRDKFESLGLSSSTFRYRREKAVRKLRRLVRTQSYRLR